MAASMGMENVELELCPNCKKEIPQTNYVMHTMHCARNISLCPTCKEPVPKAELNEHKERHARKKTTQGTQLGAMAASTTTTWKSKPFTGPFPEKLGHSISNSKSIITATKEATSKSSVDKITNGTTSQKMRNNDLDTCKYCELALPKDTIKEHENYCGTRTDKCIDCGEFVMYKYKKLHEDSNHGFIKLNDEPGPKASWDSTTQRATPVSTSTTGNYTNLFDASNIRSRRRTQPSSSSSSSYNPFDMSDFNLADYIPPSLTGMGGTPASSSTRYYDPADSYRPSGAIGRNPDKVDYKDLSRRIDSKTEYIKNLLHDSASITVPLRSSATAPRNHFNHHKGPAPQPPSALRRPNPPTELTIPCEFCHTPIPHEDLIQHETGCRPDLTRFNPRRRRQQQQEDEYRYTPSPPPIPASPEVELPCEFCSDLIPASQLLRHQATCN